MTYPSSLDELTDGVPSDGAAPTTALDNATYPHDDHHRALGVAVEAIEAELGTDPAGASATVKARLDALDTTVAGKVPASLVDAAGDLIYATAADTVARLPLGSAGQVLRVNSGATAPEWAAQSGLVVNTVAAAGSTETLAGDTYNVHDVTLDESVEFTFTTSATVAQFTLILRQDVSGGNSVTWPGSVKWHSLTAPTILTTASAVHVLEFLTVNTGTTWRGFLASSAAS